MSQQVKVYQEVLDEIQRLINEEGLKPGDKLPSERTLAAELDASRASVREALRAIELLGMIVTRQGEGTYLRDYKSFHAVKLLASFVLQDRQMVNDLAEAKEVLENHAIEKARNKISSEEIEQLEEILISNQSAREKHHLFFEKVFYHANNQLIFHIWRLMQDFDESMQHEWNLEYPYHQVIKRLKQTT